MVELAEDPKQVSERDAFVHDDPLELFEFGKMGRIDGFAPVDPADTECLDRRIRVIRKVLDRYACRMGP